MSQRKKSNEIKITRVYNAPLKIVWEAWTDTTQVTQWWGPRGFTLTTHSKDLKPGGHWHYTMHGPDGVDYPNKTHYFEVEPYKKLVYDHGANDDQPPLFRVTVVFSETKNKTQMDMTMALATPEAAEQIKKFIKQAGGNSTWDRLGEYIEKKTTNVDKFIINRTFEAPIDVVFNAWIDPDKIKQWLSPTGTEMQYFRVDIKPGGQSFYKMWSDQFTLYGKTYYREVIPNEKIVYTQQFCDENENISRHPFAPVWPETMLTTILFTPEPDDQTRITVTWETFGPCTPEELDFFIKARSGMTQGWTGSFDKLEDFLTER